MTRVSFIKIKKPEKARHLCELADEFFGEGQKVLITVMDENQAVTLDRFMWTWRKGSFLPHAYHNGAVDCSSEAVTIVTEEKNPNGANVLVMGKPCSLAFIRQFEEVVDFAEVHEPQRAAEARRRFLRYREEGFEPHMRE